MHTSNITRMYYTYIHILHKLAYQANLFRREGCARRARCLRFGRRGGRPTQYTGEGTSEWVNLIVCGTVQVCVYIFLGLTRRVRVNPFDVFGLDVVAEDLNKDTGGGEGVRMGQAAFAAHKLCR